MLARLQAAKKLFLEAYETGKVTLEQAARIAAGVDPATIWRWRKADPAFDAAVNAAQDDADAVRLTEIEEAYAARIERGEASGAEVIFYLKNRAPRRWRDVTQHEHTGKGGQPLLDVDTLRSIIHEGEAPAEPKP